MARTDALDTIANNLANSSTSGFRGRSTSFSSVLAGAGHHGGTALNQATNSYGLLGKSRLDLQPGVLQPTGNDLDVGLDGPGFLSVQTAHGTAYTRAGNLRLSPNGELQTSNGDAVLGDGGPISIPKGTTVSFGPDGTISADGGVVGKLKIVEFSPAADPQSMGGSYYTAAEKDVVDSPNTQVQQRMLEGSNVNPIAGVVELINAQRSAEGMRHALSMIDSEIDKTASQDLPRVS
jgi:flagellar basal-body rod protein FlgF/flagellar basal-body rod protein FlgG